MASVALQVLLAVAGVAALAGTGAPPPNLASRTPRTGFVLYVFLSDTREARIYRRQWREFRLKYRKRKTSRYAGTTAGAGASANDQRKG